MAATYNGHWLASLMEKEHRVHLANTAAIQQHYGLKLGTAGRMRLFC